MKLLSNPREKEFSNIGSLNHLELCDLRASSERRERVVNIWRM